MREHAVLKRFKWEAGLNTQCAYVT